MCLSEVSVNIIIVLLFHPPCVCGATELAGCQNAMGAVNFGPAYQYGEAGETGINNPFKQVTIRMDGRPVLGGRSGKGDEQYNRRTWQINLDIRDMYLATI